MTTSPLMMSRRTPRRKLFSSSEEDDSPLLISLQSSKSISFIDERSTSFPLVPSSSNDSVEVRPSMSTIENTTRQQQQQHRSKLEHFGFDMLPRRSSTLLRQTFKDKQQCTQQQRTNSLAFIHHRNNKMKKIEIQSHPMQTRSQSASDSHSDHLVKLFDQTLSTVTPVRDSTNNDEETIRQRRRGGQPLPLILSEDDTPILSENNPTTPMGSEKISNKKRALEQQQDDEEEENSGGRSLKRSKMTHELLQFHDEDNKENVFFIPPSRVRRGGLIRSLSEQQQPSFTHANEEHIKASVELGSNRNLIGDRSRTYLLPRCASRKHADLACINAETMVDLLRNKYATEIEQLYIIDCRYPYEYDGGHISQAKNLFTRPQIYQDFLQSPLKLHDLSKRIVFVFHCEFSSERAPALLRYLRSEDRNLHANNYPALHYPEVYLLEGGYKAFFEYSTEFCKPDRYRTMLDGEFQEQCRQFRSFSKQAEKFTGLNGDIQIVGGGGGSRRTRTTLRSSLSLCFTSSTNQMDFT